MMDSCAEAYAEAYTVAAFAAYSKEDIAYESAAESAYQAYAAYNYAADQYFKTQEIK